MTIVEMRKQVTAAYNGDSWKKKVAKMTDAQVQAIWFRLSNQGKLK